MRAILVAATFSGLCVCVAVRQLQHSAVLRPTAGLLGPGRSGSILPGPQHVPTSCRTDRGDVCDVGVFVERYVVLALFKYVLVCSVHLLTQTHQFVMKM